MLLFTIILLFGFASAQKVVQLTYCSIGENHLRMDCKYALPRSHRNPFASTRKVKDSSTPPTLTRSSTRPSRTAPKPASSPGTSAACCSKNLPNGKSNFTCNIKQAESGTATKTSVVEKMLLLPCSAWSVLFQSCSGLLLTLMTLPVLLETHWL